ncbi:MAG TPA: caspase family protein [Terracidiphilus sp.]
MTVAAAMAAWACVGLLYGQDTAKNRGVMDVTATSFVPTSSSSASFYALVIGNNDYASIGKLTTAVHDAESIAEVLDQKFGFKVHLLRNANRSDILSALNEIRRTLDENTNLVIYFAGHGLRDSGQAYWLPIDATQDSNVNWISAADLADDLRAIRSRHILIISDSCFSGGLARSRGDYEGITPADRSGKLNQWFTAKSRNLMASGGDEPVSDGGPDGHSVFAHALLAQFGSIDESPFPARYLSSEVYTQVFGSSLQSPEYEVIRDSGHDGGDFIFFRTVPATFTGSGKPSIPSIASPAPPPPLNPAIEGVVTALHRYADAYESESVSELMEVWPTLSKQQKGKLNATFNKMNALRMHLNCKDPAFDSDAAQVRCSQVVRYTYAGKVQPPQSDSVSITLKRSDKSQSDWLVNEVKPN